MRRFQALRHFDEAPELPSGYATMIVLAAVPAAVAARHGPARARALRRRRDAGEHPPAQAREGAARFGGGRVSAFVCPECEYAYDEETGDPREGFPPGTPWSDVPDDWPCPDCGVRDKVDFEPAERGLMAVAYPDRRPPSCCATRCSTPAASCIAERAVGRGLDGRRGPRAPASAARRSTRSSARGRSSPRRSCCARPTASSATVRDRGHRQPRGPGHRADRRARPCSCARRPTTRSCATITAGVGADELLPLLTVQGQPLFVHATERLTAVLLEGWPGVARARRPPAGRRGRAAGRELRDRAVGARRAHRGRRRPGARAVRAPGPQRRLSVRRAARWPRPSR